MFEREPYLKRLADVQRRLAANSDARSALRDRTGIVPVSQWDEYDRLWDELKAIKDDLYAIINEIIPP